MAGIKDYILCFPPGTSLIQRGPGEFEIRTKKERMQIGKAGVAVYKMLRKLASTGDTREKLTSLFKGGEAQGLLEFHFYLERFTEHRMLCHRLCWKGKPMVTIVPISPGYQFESGHVTRGRKYILSRFACIRRSKNNLILESPLSHAQLILHSDRAARLINELARPKRCTSLAGLLFYQILWNAGALSEVDAQERIMEDRDSRLLHWEFHDLLFHSRSRTGRHNNPYGKTNHLAHRLKAREIKSRKGDAIALYRPDTERLKACDVPFTQVMEMRRSQRKHGKNPITLQQIGELLYRSARVRNPSPGEGVESGRRVYPGSGAVYELELYLAIHSCDGLTNGLYYYDPVDHRLFRISKRTTKTDRLLQSAAATSHSDLPQVLILISSRFQRISRHYQSISYASILKDVGVLFQTLYLVATAMGLACCALGVGNSELFSEVTGTNYYEETSVGEFILGSCP